MSKDYNDFVARMGSFDLELPELDPSPPTKYTKITKDDNILTHYGILGMHWGVTRSDAQISKSKKKIATDQLKTGKSVSDTASNMTRDAGNITKAISDIKNTRKKEDLSAYSDDELKYLVARLNLEQQYSNISGGQVSKGAAYTKSALEIAGSALALGGSAAAIALAMKQYSTMG